MGFHDMRMHTQILFCVGLVSLATIAVVFGVAVGMFDWIGSSSKTLVTNTLEAEASDFLLQSSLGTADAIDKKLASMEEIVLVINDGVQYMFQTSIPFNPVPSYLWWNESTLPPDAAYNARWNAIVSYCCSTVYITHGDYDNYSISMEDPATNYDVTRSAHLDLFFPQLVVSNIDIAQAEIGFTQQPVLRRYPATSQYRSRDYDHRTRPWYLAAMAAQPGSPAYTSPYQNTETGGDWTIAIAIQVVVDRQTLAVAAIEMRTNTLQETILSQHIFTTGYALLLQDDGTVIAGRIFNASQNISVNLDSLPNSLQLSSLQPLNHSRVQRLTIDNEVIYVSQSDLIRNRFIVVHIAPESEILASVKEITHNIDSNDHKLLATTASIGAATLVVVILFSTFLGLTVVRPVGAMSEVAMKIVHNATKANIMEDVAYSDVANQNDEIGALARAFSEMVTKLSGKQKSTGPQYIDVGASVSPGRVDVGGVEMHSSGRY